MDDSIHRILACAHRFAPVMLAGALMVLAAVSTAHSQGQTPGLTGSGEVAVNEETNTGQDPTRPLTRLDLRYKYRNEVGDPESHIGTLRADKPFTLGDGWTLSTRVDLPFIYNDVPSLDNPGGDHEFGYSDTLIQALVVTPPHGKWAFAAGAQVIFPTASEDQFGSGKYQLVPTVAAICQLPEIRPGSFAGLLVRDQFSFAGDDDRRDINDLIVQPILNVTLPAHRVRALLAYWDGHGACRGRGGGRRACRIRRSKHEILL